MRCSANEPPVNRCEFAPAPSGRDEDAVAELDQLIRRFEDCRTFAW